MKNTPQKCGVFFLHTAKGSLWSRGVKVKPHQRGWGCCGSGVNKGNETTLVILKVFLHVGEGVHLGTLL